MHIGLAKTVRSVSWAYGSPCPNLPLHVFLSHLLLQNKLFTLLSQPMFTSQRTQPVTVIYLSLNNYHVIAILLIFKVLELELLWYLSLCLSWYYRLICYFLMICFVLRSFFTVYRKTRSKIYLSMLFIFCCISHQLFCS